MLCENSKNQLATNITESERYLKRSQRKLIRYQAVDLSRIWLDYHILKDSKANSNAEKIDTKIARQSMKIYLVIKVTHSVC